jgi:hypothetical protein
MAKPREATQAPNALQVLTTQYVIEGTVSDDVSVSCSGGKGSSPYYLTAARMQLSQSAGRPPRRAERVAIWSTTTIAPIPQPDAGPRIADRLFGKFYNKPCPGIFYLGPYVVQGRLIQIVESVFNAEMPMYGATITCALRDADRPGVRAPFAILNLYWLHAHEPMWPTSRHPSRPPPPAARCFLPVAILEGTAVAPYGGTRILTPLAQ